MQKIKVRKQKIDKVFEAAAQPKQQSAPSAAFEATCKKIFKAECAKNHLNVPLSIPKSCDSITTGLKKAPIDLKALMQNLTATEMETFKNTDGMMPDPIDTYNAAEDFAHSAFNNIPEKLKITPKKEDEEDEEVDIDIENENEGVELTSLGMSYGHVNEGEIASKIGDLAGQVAAGGVKATGQILGGIAAGAAPAAAGATAAGMAAGAMTDAVPSSHTDDSRFENRKDQVKTTQKGDDGAQYKGDDAIEAIAMYISNVTESVAQFATKLGASDEAINRFQKEIGLYVKHNDELCQQYIDANDEIIKTLKGEQSKDEKRQLTRLKNLKDIQMKLTLYAATAEVFSEEIGAAIEQIKNVKTANKAVIAIKNAIKNSGDPSKDPRPKILNKLDNFDTSDLIAESLDVKDAQQLNEDTDSSNDFAEAGMIDGIKIYEGFVQKITELCTALIPKNGQNLPGYSEAKASMEAMATKTNEEICGKIDELCKVGEGQSDFSAKISKFLSNHPLNAKGLKGVWARYYEELNSRKNRRLKMMQDLSQTEYSQGWACNIVKTVVPRTLAKMLMYRYILKLLKNKGIYSYTSLQEQKEEEFWEENKEELLKQQPVLVKLVWESNSSKLTTDGSSAANIDEDGNFNITAPLAYLGLYLAQLKNANKINGPSHIVTLFNSKDGEQFIQTMFEAYKATGYGRTLASSVDNAYKTLSATFDIKLKDEFSAAFNELKNINGNSDPGTLHATINFINDYLDNSASPADDIETLYNLYDTSLRQMSENKEFDQMMTDLDNVVGNAAVRIANAVSASNGQIKPFTDAVAFNTEDRYIKINNIKDALIEIGLHNGLDNINILDAKSVTMVVQICKIVTSGVLDHFFKAVMNDKKAAVQLNIVYKAYNDAFYAAQHDTTSLISLYQTTGIEIQPRHLNDIVADASMIDSSIKPAFKNIKIEPKQLFDKFDVSPYKEMLSFDELIDKFPANEQALNNITENDEVVAYINGLAQNAAAAVKQVIDDYSADDAVNFQSVWPSMHQIALLSKQLLKDIETVQNEGKLSGKHARPVNDAYKEIMGWINEVNSDPQFDGIDIVTLLADAKDYTTLTNDKSIAPYLSRMISLETDSKAWANLKKVIDNLVKAFKLQNKNNVI